LREKNQVLDPNQQILQTLDPDPHEMAADPKPCKQVYTVGSILFAAFPVVLNFWSQMLERWQQSALVVLLPVEKNI